MKIIISLVILATMVNLPSKGTERVKAGGYVKFVNTAMFGKFDSPWMVENMIHNRINFSWQMSDNMSFNAGMRNRFIYGDFVRQFPGYEDLISNDDGLLNFLSQTISSANSSILLTTFDRLNIEYSNETFSVTAGRQRINWGQSFVWNPNDIFNAYSFLDFDYEERPGSDALRIRLFPNFSSVVDFAVKMDRDNNITAAGLYRFNKWGYDFQFMAGIIGNEDIAAGAGWSGNLGKIGFTGETGYFHPQNNFRDTSGVLIISAGLNYMFSNSLMINVEGAYNSFFSNISPDSFTDLYYSPLSVKRITFSKFSWLTQISYPVHPLINASFASMYLPSLGNGLIVMPSMSYSAGNNFEISLRAQLFSGEFQESVKEKINMVFLRFRFSF